MKHQQRLHIEATQTYGQLVDQLINVSGTAERDRVKRITQAARRRMNRRATAAAAAIANKEIETS